MIEHTNRRTGASRARGLTRRDFLKLGGAGLAGATMLGSGALAGCGGGGSGNFNGEILVGFGRETSGALQNLIDKFNRQNNDIRATWRRQPSQTQQYFDQLRTQFQAQDGSLTVIAGDVIWPAQFASNGYILDLSDRFTEEMRARFLDGPIESNSYEGSVFGVPWFTDAGLLYYRRDLLEKAGLEPPTTYAELQEQANQIKQEEGLQFGYVFQGSEYEGGVVNGLEFVNSHGGAVLDPGDATRVVFDSPETVAGLETYRAMIESGAAPQAVSTYDEPACEAPFLGGNAVFCRNWPYMYAAAGDPELSDIDQEQVDVAPLPAGEGGQSVSGLGGWNFFINAFADEEAQDAAWEFIQFVTAEEQQRQYALQGTYLPTLKALYEDQEVADQVPTVRLAPQALANTEPRPVSPVYSDMSLQMAEQFTAVLNGDASAQETASSLQDELQSIVDQSS